MRSKSNLIILGLLLGVGTSAMAINTQAKSQEEQSGPKYEVLAALDRQVELRRYAPRLVAQVKVNGNENSSLNKGFSILAGYIFGKNKRQDRIEMTAPVLAEPENIPAEATAEPESERISMTAQVIASTESNAMTMSFFMPDVYSLDNLPEPQDRRIQLKELPEQRFAAIRFSGSWNPREFKKQSDRLQNCLRRNKLEAAGPPINAYYNPPFTLPFMRRNEVLLPLAN